MPGDVLATVVAEGEEEVDETEQVEELGLGDTPEREN